jgi:hypothetical protein
LHKRPRLDRSWSIRPNWPRLENSSEMRVGLRTSGASV